MQIKSYSFQNMSCSCSGPLWPHTTCINAMQCQCMCTPSPSMQTMQPQLPGTHQPSRAATRFQSSRGSAYPTIRRPEGTQHACLPNYPNGLEGLSHLSGIHTMHAYDYAHDMRATSYIMPHDNAMF